MSKAAGALGPSAADAVPAKTQKKNNKQQRNRKAMKRWLISFGKGEFEGELSTI
jgi:hypothetical protein